MKAVPSNMLRPNGDDLLVAQVEEPNAEHEQPNTKPTPLAHSGDEDQPYM